MVSKSLRFVVLLLLALSTAACAGMMVKNYGSFEPDRGILKAFEGYQVNPNLNYYVSGSDVHPNAIMGLNKKFTLEESLWKKVEMTPEKLPTLGRFDKLLIAPPRSGAIEVVKSLPDSGAPHRIVYVSCAPATLARDAEVLVHVKGYRLKAAGVANMFPHTAHVESIALFER